MIIPLCVEIQHPSARFQQPPPVLKLLFRRSQRPCHIPGQDQVETIFLKRHGMPHLNKTDIRPGRLRVPLRLLQHFRVHVHRCYLMSPQRRQDREKPGTGSDIQHLQRTVFLHMGKNHLFPGVPAVTGQLFPVHLTVALGTHVPVLVHGRFIFIPKRCLSHIPAHLLTPHKLFYL